MMLTIHIIGWFTFGFVVSALLLHGPVMAKAYWVRAQAILMMKNSNVKLQESSEMAKESAQTFQKYGELQDKYLAALADFNALGAEVLVDRKEQTETLKKYGDLLGEHKALWAKYEELLADPKALLWRAGGGVEGTG